VRQINVAKAIITSLPPSSSDNRDFCFSINSDTNEKLLLQAISAEDRDDWVRVLTAVASWCNHRKGLLQKKMAWKKKWKDRFFVLNGCMLSYFSNTSMSKQLGEVSLLGCDAQELPPSAMDGHKYCFELITDDKSFNLKVRCFPPCCCCCGGATLFPPVSCVCWPFSRATLLCDGRRRKVPRI